MTIRIRYEAVDGYRKTSTFKTLAGAQKYAADRVGETPDTSAFGRYAVSDDGIGKIMVEGATMVELFPKTAPAPVREPVEYDEYYSDRTASIEEAEAYAAEMRALVTPKREPGCTCSDQQLNLVGCDCAAGMPF